MNLFTKDARNAIVAMPHHSFQIDERPIFSATETGFDQIGRGKELSDLEFLQYLEMGPDTPSEVLGQLSE